MNNRPKWLAAGGLLVIVFYLGDTLYRSFIEEPTQQLTAERDALTNTLRETIDQQLLATKASKRMETYAARALPYTPQLARSSYQEWLLKLVDEHGLKSASVDAAQPVAVELKSRTKRGKRQAVGARIAYTLRAQTSLAKLAELLHEFRRAGHLHKIRSLVLNPTGGEGSLDVNLAIEVLSLNASPNKDRLSDWQLSEEALAAMDIDNKLVQRNLFARGYAKAFQDVELKAITFDRYGAAQAWFRTDSQGKTHAIGVGKQVPLPLHDISVVEILPNKVLLLVNQSPHWLTLGQSIAQVLTPEIH